MLSHISYRIFLRALYVMSVSINQNKQQGTLGCQLKPKEPDLRKSGPKLIWNSICACVWKFNMRKCEELLENEDQACVFPYRMRRNWRKAELFWLCVHCVTIKENLHIICLHELQKLKLICCWLSDHIYEIIKIAEYFVSYNGDLFQLQFIIAWRTLRN